MTRQTIKLNAAQMNDIAAFLKNLPPKQKDISSLRTIVHQHAALISAAFDQGYSADDLSALLLEKFELKISASSLRAARQIVKANHMKRGRKAVDTRTRSAALTKKALSSNRGQAESSPQASASATVTHSRTANSSGGASASDQLPLL